MGEDISRLVDGELDEGELEGACGKLRQQDGMATWVCYHVIGEALRGAPGVTPGFSTRLAAKLAAEPAHRRPHQRAAPPHRPARQGHPGPKYSYTNPLMLSGS